jgi:uncharacterized protein (DUF1499 family)
MAKRVLKGTLGLLLLAAAVWYGWQLGPWSDEAKEYRVPVDFASLERKSTPNQYIVAPPGATPRAQPDAESPIFPVPPERLRDAVIAVVADVPRTAILERSPDGLALTVVQRSAVFRFPDYIGIQILPASEGSSTLAIYSRSRFGYSDMGVNRKRIEVWLAAIQRERRALVPQPGMSDCLRQWPIDQHAFVTLQASC